MSPIDKPRSGNPIRNTVLAVLALSAFGSGIAAVSGRSNPSAGTPTTGASPNTGGGLRPQGTPDQTFQGLKEAFRRAQQAALAAQQTQAPASAPAAASAGEPPTPAAQAPTPTPTEPIPAPVELAPAPSPAEPAPAAPAEPAPVSRAVTPTPEQAARIAKIPTAFDGRPIDPKTGLPEGYESLGIRNGVTYIAPIGSGMTLPPVAEDDAEEARRLTDHAADLKRRWEEKWGKKLEEAQQ